MFRILQESMTNVLRHAKATDVMLELDVRAGHLVLVIRDNGRGITEAEMTDPRSLGILGMRERAGMVGGTVDITGADGEGTRVTVRMPLMKDQETHPVERRQTKR